jgi:hypothetical protein
MKKYKEYYKHLLCEVMDDPYRYRGTFKYEPIEVEDEETGTTYSKNIFTPTQLIKFKTDEGVEYLWYARKGRYDDTIWEIAFGTYQGQDARGTHNLDINLTKNTKNPYRVFATVISIINSFVELDEDYEIQRLHLDSQGDNRTKLYVKRLLPLIDNFKIEHIETDSMKKSSITLVRTN